MRKSTVLASDDLHVTMTRSKLAPIGCFDDKSDVIGRVLSTDVRRGQVLLPRDFVPDEAADDAIARRPAASDRSAGDWDEPTATPTPAFSGMSVHAARALAHDEGRLLVLDFTADWCPPCKQMERTTWRDQRVIDWVHEHAVVVQVDVDLLPEVSEALEIRAMPTIIVERDGRELSRTTGLMSASEILAWLDRATAGTESLSEEDLSFELRYDDVPDTGPPNPMLRYVALQGAIRDEQFDETLPEVEWLWAHGARVSPSFSAVRLSFLEATMKVMAEKHPPARESFLGLLETVQLEIDRDAVGRKVWADWSALCKVVGEEGRLLDWYEQHREPDASIDAGRYWKCSWIAADIFERLTETARYAEAGRVYRSPTVPIERQLAFLEMVNNPPVDGAAVAAIRVVSAVSGSQGHANEALREQASGISAALIAAGREDEALEVAHLLLGELDDGASRKLLVERALDWAHPLPEHVRWYAEALELGADVTGLEDRLEAAIRR
jgi:thioredoxin 1